MRRITNYGSKVLCLLLVISLLLGLVACTGDPQLSSNANTSSPTQSVSTSTAPNTQPTTVPTQPPTEPPTEPTVPPTEPTEPVDYALYYTLTEEQVTEYYRLLDECETLSIAGEDMDAIDASMEALDDMYEYLREQMSIANVFYYSSMSDEVLKQQYLDTVEIYTNANDAYIQMARRVYQSDTPAKDVLFEGWTQEDIDHLLSYDERITQLQQRNSEIKVEYQNSTDDASKIKLYIEFVGNNNEIAQFYGYDNYYDYASELGYDRDYGREELAQMRQYAQQYLAGYVDDALYNFQNAYGNLGNDKRNLIISFLYNDYDSMGKNYVKLYLDYAGDNLEDHALHMLKNDSLIAVKPDAMAGAFTIAIGDRSYCFFGPGYTNSSTVIHEAGHYYASRYADLNSIPLDLAETHSQGNEWLFMRYLKKQIASDTYQALLNYRMYNDIAMIFICLMVDEFEQRVYSTDLTGFTAEDFDAIMESVCSQYFTLDYCSANLTDIQAYWRLVVVEQPVYYISYAVSSMAAIELYTVAKKDLDGALLIYKKLCEEPLEDEGFLANITACGLSSPFSEQFFKDLAAIIVAG